MYFLDSKQSDNCIDLTSLLSSCFGAIKMLKYSTLQYASNTKVNQICVKSELFIDILNFKFFDFFLQISLKINFSDLKSLKIKSFKFKFWKKLVKIRKICKLFCSILCFVQFL